MFGVMEYFATSLLFLILFDNNELKWIVYSFMQCSKRLMLKAFAFNFISN